MIIILAILNSAFWTFVGYGIGMRDGWLVAIFTFTFFGALFAVGAMQAGDTRD